MANELDHYLDEVVREHGEPTDWIQANVLVQEACLKLGIDRQRLYGHGNISAFGENGICVRANDKIQRAWNMLRHGHKDAQEAVSDSFGDLANYGVYGVMLQKGWWTLPFDDPKEDESQRRAYQNLRAWSEVHIDVGSKREVLRKVSTTPGIASINYGRYDCKSDSFRKSTELEAS